MELAAFNLANNEVPRSPCLLHRSSGFILLKQRQHDLVYQTDSAYVV